MFNTLGNILIAILIISLALTITLPDHILEKVPFALKIKHFFWNSFSRLWELTKNMFNLIYNETRNTGSKLKEVISEGYSSTHTTITAKLDAIRDLQDALDRLTN